jgi:hypothetical protein
VDQELQLPAAIRQEPHNGHLLLSMFCKVVMILGQFLTIHIADFFAIFSRKIE